jgi:D-alanyl-lipoteichoic acid acyltransferase DltB (MBOAT superfamily)
MDFVSTVFLAWIFLFVAVSRISGNKFYPYVLIVFGLAFIFSTAPLAGTVLIAESILCYCACIRQKQLQWVYAVLSASIVVTAFLLCKYLALQNSIVLPLGISYFSFRLIHYVQENFRQRIREHNLSEFMAYMTFFPTYLVGPINLFPEFLKNLRRRKWDSSQFSLGLERIIYGYAQLIVLGDFLVNHVLKNWMAINLPSNHLFANLCTQSLLMWLDLYVRFSAYSSIAIGIAATAGFTVPENFNYPFLATNIREFWRRWHMSLTNWCREYIFIPLAAITRKPYLAIGATMITIGIWHELSLRYILWGIYHALGIIIFEKYSLLIKGRSSGNKILVMVRKTAGIVITMVFVILSFPVTSIVNNFLISIVK